MAFQSRSRTSPGAQAYDVRVLAFPVASGRTVQGLMQLFGIDEAGAQRLISNVPVILSQQASAQEAEACAQALRKLGARVFVEPSGALDQQASQWSEPSPFEEDILPRPMALPASNDTDLEFDMLSDPEANFPAPAAPVPGLRDSLDLELGLTQPDSLTEDPAARARGRQEELDLQPDFGARVAPALELEAVSTQETLSATRAGAEAPRAHAEAREPTGPQPVARPQPAEGQPQMSRAAVVAHRGAPRDDRSRTISLLQLCFALAVTAIGYWADSSILFGSAGLWSVVAHGLALYQLVVAIRGLAT